MSQANVAVIHRGEMIVGRYEIEHAIGSGGMGVVLAARHVDLDAPRAIKIPHPCEGGYAAHAERFRREARLTARLTSEHVVRVCDSGQLAGGVPYIVMERLEGMDLGDLLRRRRRLPVADSARYVAQACDAMAEAHALGILHLDLKPANLFLTTRFDGSPCIKVLDFGIARAPDALGARKPVRGELEGSAGYMAPEQVQPSAEIGPQADVWALGVILYELSTGHLPFRAGTLVATLLLASAIDPTPPVALRPDLPPALSDVILRCLEKSPARRYASVADLRAALEPFFAAGEAPAEDDDDGTDARRDTEQSAAATTYRIPHAGVGTAGLTALAEGRLRRSATLALWMSRAGAFIASVPDPLHAVVALGVGALRRYRVPSARTSRAAA